MKVISLKHKVRRSFIINYSVMWWSTNGCFHRVNGPALISLDNSKHKQWYIKSKLHRLNGPAVEHFDGKSLWYYQGNKVKCSSQEEFERLIKLRLFW